MTTAVTVQFKQLQKQLIRAGVLLLIALAAVMGINSFTSKYLQVMEDDLQAIETQTSSIRSKYNQSLADQKTSLEAIDFYRIFADSADNQQKNFDKNGAELNLKKLRDTYGLNEVQITMGSFADQPASKKENAVLSKSSSEIKLSAAYDIPVYNFIAALERDFPGQAIITSLTLKRNQVPNQEAIANIAIGQSIDVVTGDMKIDWYQTKDLVGKPINLQSRSVQPIDAPKEALPSLDPINLQDIDAPASNPQPAVAPPIADQKQNSLIPPLDTKPRVQVPAAIPNKAAPTLPLDTKPRVQVPAAIPNKAVSKNNEAGGQKLQDLIKSQPQPSLIKPEIQIPKLQDLKSTPQKGGDDAQN
jgi:hypothetical protein